MLPMDNEALVNQWLAPSFTHVEKFADLLKPAIRTTQILTPIEKPSRWYENGKPFKIAAH